MAARAWGHDNCGQSQSYGRSGAAAITGAAMHPAVAVVRLSLPDFPAIIQRSASIGVAWIAAPDQRSAQSEE